MSYSQSCNKLFFVLIVLVLISCLVEAKQVKLSVIQHFGHEDVTDTITIKPQSEGDSLEVIIPESSDSVDLENNTQTIKLLSITLKVNSEKQSKDIYRAFMSNMFAEKEVLAGHYRTFEDSYNALQNIQEICPEEEWNVVYARPWQVKASTRRASKIAKKLKENNYLQASILEEPDTVNYIDSEFFPYKVQALLIRSVNNKPIYINKYYYPGEIKVSKDSLGTFSVINQGITVEDYLRGVVPFEIGADSAPAALETQAILARTYFLANTHRYKTEEYDLCSTQHCQVYRGLSQTNSAIDKAIKNTAGQVLLDKNNNYATIFYYSSDGGHSANYNDTWADSNNTFDYIQGVATCPSSSELNLQDEKNLRDFIDLKEINKNKCHDSYSKNRRFRWTRTYSQDKLQKLLEDAHKTYKFEIKDFTEVKNIKVLERSNTGHILKLLVKTNTEEIIFELNNMRSALGGLPSTFFYVDKINNSFVFHGGGFGHAVGLSQYGAKKLAEENKPKEEILNIYFPQYKLGKL